MSTYEQQISAMGLVLPGPLPMPDGLLLPFPWVNVRGDRACIRSRPAERGRITSGTLWRRRAGRFH